MPPLQLPLGRALDRYGPRRTLLVLLAVAVLGCAAFAVADRLPGADRGAGPDRRRRGACLMAPLTCYRRLFAPAAQLRANSWMLMTGSLGMLASTLPVQWLLPTLGWRGLFWVVAALLALAMAGVAGSCRPTRRRATAGTATPPPTGAAARRVAATATSSATRCSCAWRRWPSSSTAA